MRAVLYGLIILSHIATAAAAWFAGYELGRTDRDLRCHDERRYEAMREGANCS